GEQTQVAPVSVQRIPGQPVLEPERVAEAVDQGKIDCCCHGTSRGSAPSWRSSQRLTVSVKPCSSSLLAKPPRPPLAVTRWQGITSGNQFAPQIGRASCRERT